ncbi:MAG: c-type cytochrome [Campylobacteraceae bacterium]|nr:c-type cytochrome [Campylobacteraceae bacterium]
MKKIFLSLLVAGTASLMAADGAALYKKCISCHGSNAEKKALNKSQVIAGWPAEKQIAALKGYKDGTYGGPMKALMKGQISSYSDEEIEAVSKYIESLGK